MACASPPEPWRAYLGNTDKSADEVLNLLLPELLALGVSPSMIFQMNLKKGRTKYERDCNPESAL